LPLDCSDRPPALADFPVSPSQISRRTGNEQNRLKPFVVMKFGGTSVADAECIQKVTEIVRAALQTQSVLVVVSAMAKVTDLLIEAGRRAEAGEWEAVSRIFANLGEKHTAAANALIRTESRRAEFEPVMQRLLVDGEQVCREAANGAGLSLRSLDFLSSLGERLSVRLVASALTDCGVVSEAIDATECVVTDAHHGAANPLDEPTRDRCERRLRPVLQRGVVPVVTGFLGGTTDGAITTLGRGGSDYSASIIAAALDAQEVVIWTDVGGFLTADPRLVREACTIPEISYQQAAALAYFGAKVLHPKTLQPIIQRGIPVWIRNTFAPEQRGTKITLEGPHGDAGVKALTAIQDVSLLIVTVMGPDRLPSLMHRACAALAGAHVDMILTMRTHSPNQFGLLVRPAHAEHAMYTVRNEFNADDGRVSKIVRKDDVSLVTVVGQHLHVLKTIANQVAKALHEQELQAIATSENASDCIASYVVPAESMQKTVRALHQQVQLEKIHEN
jgi:bifunctional aspartokinase / homoserine dehydrogenase 1